MNEKRIGTIIHGALGDCYEQLCAIKELKKNYPDSKWIGFFAVKERLNAMNHFELDMLDEVCLASDIPSVKVDRFYQFQVKDEELRRNVIDKLPGEIKAKFNLKSNIKPWHFIRKHDFRDSGLELALSKEGKEYLEFCMKANNIDQSLFKDKMTVGYLWRHRAPGGAFRPHFQRREEWILKTKSELFKHLIDKYDAHILICGMDNTGSSPFNIDKTRLETAGIVEGERNAKFANKKLDLPEGHCTYLKGIGFAAEMEIMSGCDLLIMMPSGFSECLWMKQKAPVILVDPPPDYMIRLTYNRMPLFNNNKSRYFYYNSFMKHTAENVAGFAEKQGLLSHKVTKLQGHKTKVLAVTNLFPSSKEPNRGIFNKQQFLELSKLCDIRVVAPVPLHKSSGILPEEMIGGIKTYHPRYFMTPKILRSLYGLFFFFGTIRKIKDIQKRFDFDCIFATWAYPDAFSAALTSKLLKRPLVTKVHGSDINLHAKSFLKRSLTKYALNASGKIIAVTEALKQTIIELGIPGHKIEVIQNGVDGELFRPMNIKECRKKMGIENDRKTILFAGNFVPVKGIKYLLEAFAALSEKKYAVSLILIGGGPDKKILKQICKDLAIDDIVRFAGRISHAEMPLWFNGADLLCLPSLNEGCPNVVLEAMACGKPAVVTNVGGLPNIIKPEENGILVRPADQKELMDGLLRALDKKWDGEAIRKEALKFNWHDSAIALENIIKDSIETYVPQRYIFKDIIKSLAAYTIPKKIIMWRKPKAKAIALTFDDGPNRDFTPKVLKILKEKGIKATFFLVGRSVEENKDLAGLIANEGHSIGMHSYSHYKFGKLDTKARASEISRSKNVITNHTGVTTNLFRPPQGAVSIGQLLYCIKNKIVTVLCSVDSMDYLNKGLDNIKERFAGNGIRGGDIILFHDDNEPTVQALPEILDGLRERNFDFVTVEELLK